MSRSSLLHFQFTFLILDSLLEVPYRLVLMGLVPGRCDALTAKNPIGQAPAAGGQAARGTQLGRAPTGLHHTPFKLDVTDSQRAALRAYARLPQSL